MERYIKRLYRFIPCPVRLAEPDQRRCIIHYNSVAVWCHLERLCSILPVDVYNLISRCLLLWLLVVVVTIALIRGIVRSIPICHLPHLLHQAYRSSDISAML